MGFRHDTPGDLSFAEVSSCDFGNTESRLIRQSKCMEIGRHLLTLSTIHLAHV